MIDAVKIYIASPYTNGDKEENINLQLEVADILMNFGYAPYTPILTHFQHLKHPRKEIEWLNLQKIYLNVCDLLIRIRPHKNGVEIPSPGADGEEKYAKELNIPIFNFKNIEELKTFLINNKFIPFNNDSYV